MSDRYKTCGCEPGKLPNPSFHTCACHSTPPAPPGLDFKAARLSCPRVGEWGHVPRDLQLALNLQHTAALQQAKRETKARIVELLREEGRKGRYPEEMCRAAYFISTLEDE